MPDVAKIRQKQVIRHENQPWIVIQNLLKTPPNLRPHVQMQIKNLVNGKVAHLRLNVGETFEVMETDIRKLEYSYRAGDVFNFIDPETFENHELTQAQVEDSLKFMAEGQLYDVLFIDERPTVLQLPASVTLKVVEAPEGIKGDSSGGVTKPVVMETGSTVQVPLFIKQGELIKVSTEDGSYQGRA